MLYTTGQLEVIGGATDDKFNMIAKGQPMIQRKVQVYCWEESQMPVAERKGDSVHTKMRCTYTKAWKSKVPDSDDF